MRPNLQEFSEVYKTVKSGLDADAQERLAALNGTAAAEQLNAWTDADSAEIELRTQYGAEQEMPAADEPELTTSASSQAAPALAAFSAAELQNRDIPPIRWTVVNLLTVGLNLIVSAPKFGKSWLALDLCLSVASGQKFLGYRVNKGGVLYLSLEDSARRLKQRMEKLLNGRPAPENFDFCVDAPNLDNGLVEALEGYLRRRPETSLIVIDPLEKIRGGPHGRESPYTKDYRDMSLLKGFADQHGVCLVIVHHVRKTKDGGEVSDPFELISGTQGLFGAADMAAVLTRERRSSDTTNASVVGRDIDAQDLVLSFDRASCRWINQGDAEAFAEAQARKEYENSPIVLTVKKLLQQSPDRSWTGTAQQLLDAGIFISHTRLAPTARDLTGKIKQLDALLLEYDGIFHTRKSNGSGGGKHTFSYSSQQAAELPQQSIFQ